MKLNSTPARPAASNPQISAGASDGNPRYNPLHAYNINGHNKIPVIIIKRTERVLYQMPTIKNKNIVPNITTDGMTWV